LPEPAAVLERLFDQYARPLYRYLARRAGAQAADDLVAETFLTALQQRHSYDPAIPSGI
jgi:DNA-directed RNA polymerase specialized sigma24 family protein